MTTGEVACWIAAAAPGTEGVTFSGGEPFDQAAALAEVARAARGLGLGVFIFTGHPRVAIEASADAGWKALLAAADLLAAGPYEKGNPGHHPMLASANQELVFLTNRYRNYDFGRQRRVEYRIGADGNLRISGLAQAQEKNRE